MSALIAQTFEGNCISPLSEPMFVTAKVASAFVNFSRACLGLNKKQFGLI